MFEGPVIGNIPEVLDNGEVTDGTHVTAGQLALALTPYAQVTDLAVNTAAAGNNAAAIQSLDDRVTAELASKLDSSALAPAIAPLATAAALATTDRQVAAHGSSIAALQSSLTTGLSNKADQSAFDALEGVVATKSTPDGVDLKRTVPGRQLRPQDGGGPLPGHSGEDHVVGGGHQGGQRSPGGRHRRGAGPKLASRDASISGLQASKADASALTAYALQSAVDTSSEVDLKISAALLGAVTTAALDAALLGKADASALASLLSTVDGLDTPLDVDTKIANALLGLATEAFVVAQLASRDASITALQGAKADATLLASYATNAALSASETTLQSALDAILAELAALQLSGSGVVNAPAWAGFTTWELLRGSSVVRNLHFVAPLSAALANGDDTLSITADCYSTAGTDAAITAALLAYYTSSQVDTLLGDYHTGAAQDAETAGAITAALLTYYTSSQVDALLGDYRTASAQDTQTQAAIAGALLAYRTGPDQDVFTTNQITSALVAYRSAADQDTATASSIAAALLSYYTIAQVDGLLAGKLGVTEAFPDDGGAAIGEQILGPTDVSLSNWTVRPSSGCSVVLATHTAGVSVDGYTLTLAANPWNIVRTYNLTPGRELLFACRYRLGTASNFVVYMSEADNVHDPLYGSFAGDEGAWSTAKMYFTVPPNGAAKLHFGAHFQAPGLPNQTAGTVDVYGLQILDATLEAGNTAEEEDTAASALLLKHEFLDGGADDVTLATLGEVLLEPTLTALAKFSGALQQLELRGLSQLRGGRLPAGGLRHDPERLRLEHRAHLHADAGEMLLLRLPVPAGHGLQLGDVRQRGRQRLRGRHRHLPRHGLAGRLEHGAPGLLGAAGWNREAALRSLRRVYPRAGAAVGGHAGPVQHADQGLGLRGRVCLSNGPAGGLAGPHGLGHAGRAHRAGQRGLRPAAVQRRELHRRVHHGRGRLGRSLLRSAHSHRHRRRSHAVVHRGRVRQLAEHQRRGQRGPAELRHRNHGQHVDHQQHGQRRELHHGGRRVHGHADGLGRSNGGELQPSGRSRAPR